MTDWQCVLWNERVTRLLIDISLTVSCAISFATLCLLNRPTLWDESHHHAGRDTASGMPRVWNYTRFHLLYVLLKNGLILLTYFLFFLNPKWHVWRHSYGRVTSKPIVAYCPISLLWTRDNSSAIGRMQPNVERTVVRIADLVQSIQLIHIYSSLSKTSLRCLPEIQ